ncbi:MAG: sigma-70 family RNA polymerase sigma factor [Bacteroidota bacterium]
MPDYTAHSDQELIQLFAAGSDTAFREIYLRYDKPLYLYAYHKLGNKEECRDIVQDVFAWLLNNRSNLNLTTTLSGYLYKSVLNKIYNLYKHNEVLRKYASEGNGYVDLEHTETDFLIREKDISAVIEQEIAAMPRGMREVYELRRKQYLSTKETAEQLGVAESTVITQMKRAKKQLRLKLGLLVLLISVTQFWL